MVLTSRALQYDKLRNRKISLILFNSFLNTAVIRKLFLSLYSFLNLSTSCLVFVQRRPQVLSWQLGSPDFNCLPAAVGGFREVRRRNTGTIFKLSLNASKSPATPLTKGSPQGKNVDQVWTMSIRGCPPPPPLFYSYGPLCYGHGDTLF